ncbi:DUF4253 domain-containing protein [Promicromonospora sukumoe]
MVPDTVRAVTHTNFPALPEALPAGRIVDTAEHDRAPSAAPARGLLWMSDAPVDAAGVTWTRLRNDHERSGLYPVLLEHDYDDSRNDRWSFFGTAGGLDVDPETALRTLWDRLQEDREPEEDDEDEIPEEEWPAGPWPGLAPAGTGEDSPWAMAEQYAAHLQDDPDLHGRPPRWRLGLIPADTGAGALTLVGWDGPCNHTNQVELISAALRTWEERFGVRVVGLGSDRLWVSVARPPKDLDHARAVALEHFAFCPDNLWQGGYESLDAYAAALVGANSWTFWWD